MKKVLSVHRDRDCATLSRVASGLRFPALRDGDAYAQRRAHATVMLPQRTGRFVPCTRELAREPQRPRVVQRATTETNRLKMRRAELDSRTMTRHCFGRCFELGLSGSCGNRFIQEQAGNDRTSVIKEVRGLSGSGPGGRWFESTRPDQFFQQLRGSRRANSPPTSKVAALRSCAYTSAMAKNAVTHPRQHSLRPRNPLRPVPPLRPSSRSMFATSAAVGRLTVPPCSRTATRRQA
jgi:hypothetical protein